MNLTQQTTGHFFAASHASVCYHTLIYGFQVRIERERKTYGLEEWTQSRIYYTHAWKRDCPRIFSGLCMQSRASILLQTLPKPHYACCWCHWYDNKTNVAQNAAGTSHGPLVWRNAPWLQKTYQMEQKTQPTTNLLLSCNNNTPPTAGWGNNNLKKRRQMR